MVGKQIDLSTTKPVLSVAEGKTKIYLGFSWCCRVFVVFFLKMMPVGFTARKSTLALMGRRLVVAKPPYELTMADGEKLITAVVHPTITQYDINPLTTLIAKKAKSMGGYSHANMVRAAEGTVTVPDANKTTEGFRGDPTTQYGGWH